jgi:hypothetical protein
MPESNQITCPKCLKLFTVPAVNIGSIEQCPHCDKWFAVSANMIPSESGNVGGGAEEYGVKIEVAPHPRHSVFRTAIGMSGSEEAVPEANMPLWRPVHPPPPGIFLLGTFTFPFHSGSRSCFVVLSIFTFIVYTLAGYAIYFGSFSSQLRSSIGPWIASLFCTFMGVMLSFILLITYSAFGLAILKDTAEGSERFVSWPRGWFIDWIEEMFYIFLNLFYGVIPAVLLLAVLPDSPGVRLPVIIFTESILFPLFLMSALAGGSAAMPHSAPVWRSLSYAWHAWILYYLFTILIGEAFVFFLLKNPFTGFWQENVVFSLILPFFWIVYFRLLGRLAWFCSGRFEEMHPYKEDIGIEQMEEEDD